MQVLQVPLPLPIYHAGNAQNEPDELKSKQKDKKRGMGSKQIPLMLTSL